MSMEDLGDHMDEMVDSSDASDYEENGDDELTKLVWRKSDRPLEKDEILQVAPGCYAMLHTIIPNWSCLSFDILKDDLGACRLSFPHTSYIVTGTQPDASHATQSLIHVMKWSNMTQNEGDEDDDEIDDSTSNKFYSNSIAHNGIVNRIRTCPQSNRLVCTMAETSLVHVWDINSQLEALKNNTEIEKSIQEPLFTCTLHKNEGYALGWNSQKIGLLASGDNDGLIVRWDPIQGGWNNEACFKAPASIEDIEWRPGEEHLFASACCDGFVRIHDIRMPSPVSTIMVTNGPILDVNALSWNPTQTNLLATGDEIGQCNVYDIRFSNAGVAQLKWHREAITSVSWHPSDASVVACSSRDDSISIWDLSIESENVANDLENKDIPHQLMFIHMGQVEITEIKFHPQIPGMVISTAVDGFNAFKCSNID
ncbi:bifunctional WD40-YVTN repeat-like-containing domain superfamily/Histone-binding protein RBBP4 [Babesia duncani]|uniref:Bifunctional WD40-YVTN repeat-like-containing domain superfamily/Histone-binding protein RBBP4 n=1 Tax=Babesia duncani TaxID=323732 RepID=A0AAD9PJ61_9APIC|nr:bifunctional WD40-YVTN repeat-like-containing domain superfamily/Histone-binding protein RBBP4 [Babesia duncani]